jgi:acyl carrier protein
MPSHSPDGEAADPRVGPLLQRLVRLVEQILDNEAQARDIDVDARLSNIGMDSLKMVNLMLLVEAEFGHSIPQREITPDNFRSVASVAALVARLSAASGSP